MANQAYNGQPINIQFDYEGEGTMDSKLVQLSETAAKDPTTWLKNGIYRIGNGQPVFTQDGKLLLYIGRNGNATDIADDTKWIKFTSTADVQTAIQTVIAGGGGGASNAFHIVDYNISAKPTTDVEAGNAYVVGRGFSLTSSDVLNGIAVDLEAGDMLVAVDVEVETEEDGETVTSNVIKFAVLQANTSVPSLAASGFIRGNNLPSAPGKVLAGYDAGGINIVSPTSMPYADFERFAQDWLGTATDPIGSSSFSARDNTLLDLLNKWYGPNMGYTGYQTGRFNTHKHFLDNFEKIHMLAMVSAGIIVGTDEDAFIAAVQALQSNTNRESETRNYPSPLEFVMCFGWDSTNDELRPNFFGFTKSMPYIRGVWQKGRGTLKGTIHFKNYDLAGTLSNPCVEYTYDMDTKVLSYQKFIEVTVSNS